MDISCTFTELMTDSGKRFVNLLEDVRSVCDDLSVPMVTIARGIEEEIRAKAAAGPPPPLTASTIKRWGAHPILNNTGEMIASIHHWSGPMSAAAGTTHRAAVFVVITGREAGGASATRREARRKDRGFVGPGKGVRRAGRVPKRGGDVESSDWIRWGDMPVRDFIWIGDVRQEWAANTILDYLFLKFNE